MVNGAGRKETDASPDDPRVVAPTADDHYRALAEIGSDYAYYSTFSDDGSSRLEWVTGDFEGVTGYTLEQINEGSGWMQLLDPDDLPTVQAVIDGFSRNESWSGELRLVRRDGRHVWTITAARPILNDDGRLSGVYGAVHDISRQKRAQLDLEEVQGRYRDLVEQIPGVVYVAEQGIRGRWHFVGPKIEALLGYGPDEWMADPNLWFERVHPDDQDTVLEVDATMHLQDGDQTRTVEYRMLTRDGRVVWVRDAQVFERGEPGGPTLIRGVLFDITKEKLLEDRAHQAQKMEALGQLAGGLAHDFNNLLSVILNYSDLIPNDLSDSDRVLEDLSEIRAAAERARALTKQLLLFSRREPVHLTPVDLNQMVENVSPMLQRTVGENIDLITDLEPGLPKVKADPGQTEQILLGLALNARDAMPKGGTVHVTTRSEDGRRRVELSIRDTGSGMTEAVRRRAMDPFFTTKPAGQGSGLGLSTAFGVVKQWEGSLDIESGSRGTNIRIRLPSIEENPGKDAIANATAPAAPVGRVSRVLVVDDEEALRRVTSRILQKHGLEVVAVAQAAEAIAAIEEDPSAFDVLLTDVVMPQMSGIELVKELRRRGHTVRAVYMSGYSTDIIESQGQPDGPLIEKPFTAQVLLTALGAD